MCLTRADFFLSDVFINDNKAGQESTIMLSMLSDGKLEGAENIWEKYKWYKHSYRGYECG